MNKGNKFKNTSSLSTLNEDLRTPIPNLKILNCFYNTPRNFCLDWSSKGNKSFGCLGLGSQRFLALSTQISTKKAKSGAKQEWQDEIPKDRYTQKIKTQIEILTGKSTGTEVKQREIITSEDDFLYSRHKCPESRID